MKNLLLLVFLLSGCSLPMDEVIRDVKKCREAGMSPHVVVNGITLKMQYVMCTELPSDKPLPEQSK